MLSRSSRALAWLALPVFLSLSGQPVFGQPSGGVSSGAPSGGFSTVGTRSTSTPNSNDIDEQNRIYDEERDRQSGRRVRAARPAEVVAGKEVMDSRGKPVGTIESVDADGAVVTSGTTKIRVSVDSFNTDGRVLRIGVTKAKFDAMVAKANAAPGG